MRDIDKAAFYAPNPEECSAIAPHAARVVDRLSKLLNIPDVVHEVVTTSDDSVLLMYAVTGYLDRIGVLDKILPVFSGLFRGRDVIEPVQSNNGKLHATDPRGSRRSNPAATTEPTINGIPVSSIPGLGAQFQS